MKNLKKYLSICMLLVFTIPQSATKKTVSTEEKIRKTEFAISLQDGQLTMLISKVKSKL